MLSRAETRDAPTIKGFARLTLGAASVTFLMITIGAITRVSESGMGCGVYWPSCNGKLLPEFVNAAVVIEFSHRIFALIVGGFSLAVTVQAWRFYGPTIEGKSRIGAWLVSIQVKDRVSQPRILILAGLGLILYFVQSGLGAVTVASSNQWLTVLLHLGNSMLLLACYLVLWVAIRRIGAVENMAQPMATLPLIEVILAAALSFNVALIGAAVAGNVATKACVGWPLCAGQLWPSDEGPLQMLNMLHRLVVGGLGIILILMVIQGRGLHNRTLYRALHVAFGLFFVQAALGAMVVLIPNREWLVVARSLHVTFAAATWSAIVIVSAIAWQQQLPNRQSVNRSSRAGVPSATTSS